MANIPHSVTYTPLFYNMGLELEFDEYRKCLCIKMRIEMYRNEKPVH